MKMLGHPIHPLLVHFPTALLPADLVLSILYHATGDASYYTAGFYCLVGGVVLGLPAAVSGLIDLVAIPKKDKSAIGLALYHGMLNGSILLVFGVLAWKAGQAFPAPWFTGLTAVIVKGILLLALFVGNYMGGKLIYKHHIGIQINQDPHANTAT